MAYNDLQARGTLTELDTRTITMPNGSTRALTLPRWTWAEHDFVVEWFNSFNDREAWLVKLAVVQAEEQGDSFDDIYPLVIEYVAGVCRSRRAAHVDDGTFGTA